MTLYTTERTHKSTLNFGKSKAKGRFAVQQSLLYAIRLIHSAVSFGIGAANYKNKCCDFFILDVSHGHIGECCECRRVVLLSSALDGSLKETCTRVLS